MNQQNFRYSRLELPFTTVLLCVLKFQLRNAQFLNQNESAKDSCGSCCV